MILSKCVVYVQKITILVNEFCRLKNIKRPDKLSPIENQIDKACGYDAGMEFMKLFTDFVREFIYIPLMKQQNNEM